MEIEFYLGSEELPEAVLRRNAALSVYCLLKLQKRVMNGSSGTDKEMFIYLCVLWLRGRSCRYEECVTSPSLPFLLLGFLSQELGLCVSSPW